MFEVARTLLPHDESCTQPQPRDPKVSFERRIMLCDLSSSVLDARSVVALDAGFQFVDGCAHADNPGRLDPAKLTQVTHDSR